MLGENPSRISPPSRPGPHRTSGEQEVLFSRPFPGRFTPKGLGLSGLLLARRAAISYRSPGRQVSPERACPFRAIVVGPPPPLSLAEEARHASYLTTIMSIFLSAR